MISDQKKIQHLFWRGGFGISYGDLLERNKKSLQDNVEAFFSESEKFLELDGLEYEMDKSAMKNLSKDERKKLRQEFFTNNKNLNLLLLQKMSNDTAQLREKMTFFWHGHFACRNDFPSYAQELNNILRRNALGNFKTMVTEVSKSAAMLQFLNNQQNRKEHPNENFARELMELFTLGRGNYTEADIKESARAFTGWSFGSDAKFQFRPGIHDYDTKTFLGKTGKFDGDEIIAIIMEKKQPASFICKKLYKFFVNDRVNEDHVNELADVFFNSGYEIKPVMKKMFSSEWFYTEENIGTHIKSPVEFIAGLNRTFGVEYGNPPALLFIQRLLGQILFYPPNVGGWNGGRTWIDSSTLMFRLKLPSLILNSGIIEMEAKDMPEDFAMMSAKGEVRNAGKKIQSSTDWKIFAKQFANVKQENIPDTLCEYLLQPKLSDDAKKLVLQNSSDEIKNLALMLVSLPEYQLS